MYSGSNNAPRHNVSKQKKTTFKHHQGGISDQHFVLDSFEKLESSRPEHGEFQFNFSIQGTTRNQAIGVRDEITSVIGIQVCEFIIPNLIIDDFDPFVLRKQYPSFNEW